MTSSLGDFVIGFSDTLLHRTARVFVTFALKKCGSLGFAVILYTDTKVRCDADPSADLHGFFIKKSVFIPFVRGIRVQKVLITPIPNEPKMCDGESKIRV